MHTRVVQFISKIFFFFGMLQTMEGEDEVSRDFRLKINNNNEVRMKRKE